MTGELQKDRNKSLWEEIKLPPCATLSENLKTGVCVIGGGMSGLSIAYQLGKRGFKVVLLEGARLGSGQSGRTTAHLSYQLEEPFSQLLKHHNMKSLSLFVDSHKKAIDTIEEIIFQENIHCEFQRLDGYLFLGPRDKVEMLEQEVAIGKELGLKLTMTNQIPSFPKLGPAVIFPHQAQFHPLKYLAGLLHALKDLDVSVYENSHVQEIHHQEDSARVITNQGYQVESNYLVVATDTPVNNRFYIHSKQAAYRTYVVGFHLNRKVEVPLMWDTADPYHYIRQQGDILLVGGEDHRCGQNPKTDPFKELEYWARNNFSFLGEVSSQWSGQVFEPVDQMGFIGRNPGNEKNVFITTGESGIGMTSATIASLLIPDLIEKKENSWAAIYDPGRVHLNVTKEFIKENANIAFQYTDWITPSQVSKREDIPLDQGAVLREGLSKVCVFHESSEIYEKKSAVCPHLGGVVHWNDFEKTWDCPCHGSRFSSHGKVIEGPSLNDLMER